MGKALYRKYRSRSLDEIVGQSHITALLKRAISSGNVAHAYLLTGPRGVGKTSIARILAHEINNLPYEDESTHLDIIEIDAASNNSVEDIRDLREKVMIAPSVAAKKVYIIDEVHMLSKSAFNALLKTLEEPPEHVVFILATTDADKLPPTIISRVQRFNFRTIGASDVATHLRTIANAESIAIDDAALELVARHGSGSFRDSISLLDQLRSLTDDTITPELIESVLGLADAETVQLLLQAYEAQDIAAISRLIADTESRGTPAIVLANQLIHIIRRDIGEKPQYLPLLDALLDINRSAWPHVKLLVALASKGGVNNIHAPSVPTRKTTITQNKEKRMKNEEFGNEELESKKTGENSDRSIAQAEENKELERRQEQKLESQKVAKSGSDDGSREVKTSATTKPSSDQPFPWADFLAHVKETSPGVHALLTKCGYEFDGTTLTVYGGKPFTKKKIDQALPSLAASLEAVGVADGTITVLASSAPAKDSQNAAILAMMGGGEEVSL